MVLVATVIAYILGVNAVRRLSAAVGATVASLEVIAGAVVAWVLVGEALGPFQIVGGLIVLVGRAARPDRHRHASAGARSRRRSRSRCGDRLRREAHDRGALGPAVGEVLAVAGVEPLLGERGDGLGLGRLVHHRDGGLEVHQPGAVVLAAQRDLDRGSGAPRPGSACSCPPVTT